MIIYEFMNHERCWSLNSCGVKAMKNDPQFSLVQADCYCAMLCEEEKNVLAL